MKSENSSVNMENNEGACICCGANNCWQKVVSLPAFIFGSNTEIYACSVCGMGRTAPKPNTPIGYYEQNGNYDALFAENEALYKSFARKLLRLLEPLGCPAGKRLLDVGCGGGFLVSVANELGFLAQGIDANKDAVQWAQKRGANVVQGDIQKKLSGAEKFDVIVLSAVLEHISSPAGLLKDCAKLLAPDGVILVSQASYDGLLPRFFPWGWYGWQPIEHYWHFTPHSFSIFAASCGLNIAKCSRNSLFHRYYRSGGLKVIIGRNVATVIARVGDIIGRGDSFDCTLVVKKESRG